jgi:hypothetical protein
MPPVYVRTPEELRSLVTIRATTESLFLDFKAALECKKDDWQLEVGQDVSQFANTLGGCLLIGVAEGKDSRTGLKLATAFKGVKEPDRVREWVETAIANVVVPSTVSHTVDMVVLPTGPIVAVNVPPSRRLVYVWDRSKETIRCVYRTNHGKARMNPDEMERQMMNGSRAARLAFMEARRASAGDKIEVLGGVWQYRTNNLHHLPTTFEGTISDDTQESSFQIVGRAPLGGEPMNGKITIPYDVLRSVWVNSGGKLTVLLSVRLLVGGDKNLTLEPF